MPNTFKSGLARPTAICARRGRRLPGLPTGSSPSLPEGCAPAGLRLSQSQPDSTRTTHLKYRTEIALSASLPSLAAVARHWSWMMVSTMALDLPYADSGWIADVSGMGMTWGVPYTVAEEEKTKFLVPWRSMACMRPIEPPTLTW